MKLNEYGSIVRKYVGEGTLLFPHAPPLQCSFEAGQLSDGEVVVLCHTASFGFPEEPTRLVGVTHSGWSVTANFERSLNFLAPSTSLPDGSYYAYRTLRLHVDLRGQSPPSTVRFGVVNFRFTG
jgi:hypothetical protein